MFALIVAHAIHVALSVLNIMHEPMNRDEQRKKSKHIKG